MLWSAIMEYLDIDIRSSKSVIIFKRKMKNILRDHFTWIVKMLPVSQIP